MDTACSKYLNKESVLILEGLNKRDVINEILNAAEKVSPIARDIMDKAIWQREKMMTTGLGHHLGMPHIRHSKLGEPILLVGVCKNEITDYASVDNLPIRVIVFLAAPEGDQENYLKLLGSISSKFRDETLIAEILENIDKPSKILTLLKKKSA
ncbi:MAG: hypothetical protein A2020_00055 [Lentisphaerae bacterium GWF2_45_14]|nr:MAG: hypothetical protein A2020_00055 [Lentisphaerae bacterium GWF2_45_14]